MEWGPPNEIMTFIFNEGWFEWYLEIPLGLGAMTTLPIEIIIDEYNWEIGWIFNETVNYNLSDGNIISASPQIKIDSMNFIEIYSISAFSGAHLVQGSRL